MEKESQRWNNCRYAVGFIGDRAFSPGLLPDDKKGEEFDCYGCRNMEILKRGAYPKQSNVSMPELGEVPPQSVAVFYHQINNNHGKSNSACEPRACTHCGLHSKFKSQIA